jgi:hypothetical protein
MSAPGTARSEMVVLLLWQSFVVDLYGTNADTDDASSGNKTAPSTQILILLHGLAMMIDSNSGGFTVSLGGKATMRRCVDADEGAAIDF